LNSSVRKPVGGKVFVFLTLAAVAARAATPAVSPNSALMPVAEQNRLIQTYCAVCHTDAAMNGLLSLQHFDAAHADPQVAAFLLSKLTSGLTPAQVLASHSDPTAAALVANRVKTGAMGAAGVPVPDKATQDALMTALAMESTGASGWTVEQGVDASVKGPVVRANLLREAASTEYPDTTDMYRLSLLCRADNHEGEMQLAWAAGVPKNGRVASIAVDGKAPFTYTVSGTEKMGNGTSGGSGPGAAVIAKGGMPLPAQSVTVSNLFSDETVTFSFTGLDKTTRKSLAACFRGR
jgi:hypothetical protein